MLNKTTILLRVVIHAVADQFMDGSPTDANRGTPSVRGIKLNLRLLRTKPGKTSNLAIIPSTAAGEIQANKSKDSDLIGDSPSKPATKPSSGQNCTQPKQPNPTLNRTCNSVRRPGLISLWPGRRPLPHAG